MTHKIGITEDNGYPAYVFDEQTPDFKVTVSDQWYRRARRIMGEYEELQNEIEVMERNYRRALQAEGAS